MQNHVVMEDLMKQIIQSLASGETTIENIPCPQVPDGHVLIKTMYSLVSAGTEKMLVGFGKSNYFQKARQQPDKVKEVINKARTDGIVSTLEAVQSKLDTPIPLGYSNVGTVIDSKVPEFKIGDLVVSNGNHAEVVCIPKNLCAKVPEGVTPIEASFTVVASIALQSIRLANPTLGETFAVSGLGLIGLIAVQILKANGCNVIGLDYNEDRLAIASRYGARTINLSNSLNPSDKVISICGGSEVDGVIIAATTTSSEPISQAAKMTRKRGRIVMLGVTGMELVRSDFYEKEISFVVSCSYGAGRYEKDYETKGLDYPRGYIRWTENRNFETILNLLADEKLCFDRLQSKVVNFLDAPKEYQSMMESNEILGLILKYSDQQIESLRKTTIKVATSSSNGASTPSVALVGSGSYASRYLAPSLSKSKAELHTIVSKNGQSASIVAKRHGFHSASTSFNEILQERTINTVVIATPHNLHGEQVSQCLKANKHVFVEKPLALNFEELELVNKSYNQSNSILMVGFNRRFSVLSKILKKQLSTRTQPLAVVYTVNAGHIPADHWTQDLNVGGGRILGEVCHFIDYIQFVFNSRITSVQAQSLNPSKFERFTGDTATIVVTGEDGSIGTIHYFANGNKSYPKEKVEVFSEGRILILDNFRKLTGHGFKDFSSKSLFSQDKGQNQCVIEFIDSIRKGNPAPIEFDELMNSSAKTIEASIQIFGS